MEFMELGYWRELAEPYIHGWGPERYFPWRYVQPDPQICILHERELYYLAAAKKLPDFHRLLWLYLAAESAHDPLLSFKPCYATLMAVFDRSKPTIVKGIDDLIERGFIGVKRGCWHEILSYHIQLPDWALQYLKKGRENAYTSNPAIRMLYPEPHPRDMNLHYFRWTAELPVPWRFEDIRAICSYPHLSMKNKCLLAYIVNTYGYTGPRALFGQYYRWVGRREDQKFLLGLRCYLDYTEKDYKEALRILAEKGIIEATASEVDEKGEKLTFYLLHQSKLLQHTKTQKAKICTRKWPQRGRTEPSMFRDYSEPY